MIIFWTIVLVVLLIYIQYLVFFHFSLKKVSYDRKFLQLHAFEQESFQLEEYVENRKKLWIPWLYVESLLDKHLVFGKQENLFVSSGSIYQNHASFFVMKGYSRIIRTHQLYALKRGVYSLSSVTLSSGDLFGFRKCVETRQLSEKNPLIVYPKPELPPFYYQNNDYSLGDHSVKRFIMPDPFLTVGTRQFVPGDAIKSINWHASARTGELQVNQYDYTSNKRLMVLINCEDHETMWKNVNNTEIVEQYIRYAAGITSESLEQGFATGIATNMASVHSDTSNFLTPESGQTYWYTILDYLAHLKIEREQPFHELLESFMYTFHEPTSFVILSSYWNEQLDTIANQLRYRQHHIIPIQMGNQTGVKHIREVEHE